MSANPDPEVPITPIAADDRSTRFLFSCYCMKLYGASAASGPQRVHRSSRYLCHVGTASLSFEQALSNELVQVQLTCTVHHLRAQCKIKVRISMTACQCLGFLLLLHCISCEGIVRGRSCLGLGKTINSMQNGMRSSGGKKWTKALQDRN